jgi:hypothetical protein
MKLVNNLMKAPEMAATMQELSKEMMKVFLPYAHLSYKMVEVTLPLLLPQVECAEYNHLLYRR